MSRPPRNADDVDVADIQDITTWLQGARGWQSVLASGLAVLTAATVTVAVAAPDPASADTFVSVAREAQVYLPDGTNHPAVEGERLVRGAELHTGSQGGAQLTTAGRTVYVGRSSTLSVVDGVRQELGKGLVMVDSRRGARLDLTTAAGTVRAAGGALVRVEESVVERVAVYEGSATLQPAGRSARTEVAALHQVKVQPGSLPQRATALILRNDDWDKTLAAGLVAADQELSGLAAGLQDATGATYLSVAPAALRSGPTPAAGAARGEEALTVAIAQVARRANALSDVRADRADNASWGVIAALVEASVDEVSSVLSAALAPTVTPGSGPVNAGGVPNTPGGVAPTTAPVPGATRTPSTRPTQGPSGPTPTPSASPEPGLVNSLVDTVVGLLQPSPTPSSTAPAPATSPGGLLGGLLPKK